MKEPQSLQQMLNSANIKRRFEEILDTSAPSFISSILTIVRGSSKLQECSAQSVVAAAGMAAALKLPLNPSLGFAHIVPYKSQAQFQIGAKGFVQLAMRSGQYRTLHSGPVREGQIKEIDFLTGEIIRGEKISDEIVGYVAYMELLNGFKKSLYMTVEELTAHAEKYSQSYAYDLRSGRKSSVWSTNFDAMAKKTVLKHLLSHYGIISLDQQGYTMIKALQADQSVITDEGFRYIDNEHGEEKIIPFSDLTDVPKVDAELEENNSDESAESSEEQND